MINIDSITKNFDQVRALENLSLSIPQGEVFGMIGTNGAGKSTLLRIISGVIRPDEGSVAVDGEPVYENTNIKQKIFYLSDDAAFFANASPDEMARFYSTIYPEYDMVCYRDLMDRFHLSGRRQIRTFSKGMTKQLLIILGISSRAPYLLCDETFDGLDPVMRQAVKSIFAGQMLERTFTPIIASHNLRELEDICDRIGLLHEGGILLDKQLYDMKLHIHRIQCVLSDRDEEEKLLAQLDTLLIKRQGSLLMITARGTREEIMEVMNNGFCIDNIKVYD